MKEKTCRTTSLVLWIIFILICSAMIPAVSSSASNRKCELFDKIGKANKDSIISSTESNNTEYYAVITACSQYKDRRSNIPKPPFPPFPERKLKTFYSALLNSENWIDDNIILLLNEDASKQNIINALEEMTHLVGPNDIFVFTWNGHGSQVPDDNGDESTFDENDEYDEVICPYDCERDENKDLINYISDDELDNYFSNITCKGMCLIFDSCLSGGLVDKEPHTIGVGDINSITPFHEDLKRDIDGSKVGTIDVNKKNRIVITSTFPETLGKASFLTASSLFSGMGLSITKYAKDTNDDGFISVEEVFTTARPIILIQNSLYWAGSWIYSYFYFLFDLYDLIPFKKPSLIEELFNKPALSATCSLVVTFLYSQTVAMLLTGHYLCNWPTMCDNYDGEMPLIEL